MNSYLNKIKNARVLVLGDLMLDRYWSGSTSRISPEAPVPVVKVNEAEDRVGGAGNVAANIISVGAAARVLGVTGQDENAHLLQQILRKAEVQTCLLNEACCTTITKLRVLSRHQQLIRLDFEADRLEFNPRDLLQLLEQHSADCDVLVLSDYNKGTLADPQPYIQYAREHNIPVIVDPKGDDFAKYRGATLLTPNLSEFENIVGPCAHDDELVAKGLQLIEQLELDSLLITRSEAGMTLLQQGQASHFSAEAKDVYDVTGAGDTVIAVFASAIAAGLSFVEAARLANVAAGIVVGRLGAASVTLDELLDKAAPGTADNYLQKIISAESLATAIKKARQKGERVVMTNGCFDILHAGHVQYLHEAAKLGDRLIVAVNTDASVKRLKGESRPVNSLASRMEVLAGLACVDWVVDFDTDTPEALICDLLPDVLVKGGDYQVDQIAGGDCVMGAGGEVKILSLKDGCSTTGIIDKIQK